MTAILPFLNPEAVRETETKVVDTILSAARSGRLAIVGSAALARKCAKALHEAGGSVRAFIEYDPRFWGRNVDGINVLSADEAFADLGPDAVIVAGVWSPHHRYGATEEWLKSFGFKRVFPAAAVFWAAFEFTGAHYQLAPPAIYGELRDRATVLYAALTDEVSRQQLYQHLLWRVTLDSAAIPVADREHVYFDPRLFKIPDDATIVDVGAFDGDSLRSFLHWKGRKFGHYCALEPDAISFERLRAYIAQLPNDVARRIEIFQTAAGESDRLIRIAATGKPGSSASADKEAPEVPCVRIADLFAGRRVDYLKLDIEGAERAALEGAWGLFADNRPIAAIAVYHRPADVVDLPLMLIERLERYHYYLRSHDDDGIDLVFYAVPDELASSPDPGVSS
jgi:FkbM family methyltransferase